MTAQPWPCARCGLPGVRNLGTRGYCSEHLAELFATFDPRVFALAGLGVPSGRARPDLGPSVQELRCIADPTHTWCGVAGERCDYCADERERLLKFERERLLRVPDECGENAIRAWGERLRRSVQCGIITKAEARRVWSKAVNRVTAA